MAGIVPADKIELIRSASDIVEIISAVLPLRRAGANFVGLCPFHREKSPSFNVNPHRQIFHCFGCQKGGDVFTFIREYENLSFLEAVKRLADRASIPLEFEDRPGESQARHVKETLLQMHDQIASRWQTALATDPAGQIARDYLVKRGVSEEAVKQFRIGYAPELWDDTVNWAKSRNYDLALAEQGGLIVRKGETDHHYDRFRGRLMFPICDEQGRVIGFSGRILASDASAAKYVNSPETPIFTKGKVFFGLDKSKRAILDAGFAILCEGQLDLIACHMGGVRNVVAPQGTAFTPDHARILKRYVEEVVFCFDSDAAGQNAAVRALDSLLAAGLAVRVALVPAPHDPDTYIKEHGGEAFQRLVDGAEGFFDFYLGRLCSMHDVSTDKGRVALVREMRTALGKVNNAVLFDTYAQKTALRLGVSTESVRAEFMKRTPDRAGAVQSADHAREDQEEAEVAREPAPSEREFWLLRFLLMTDEHLEWVAAHVQPEWLEHGTVRRVVEARIRAHTDDTWRGVPALMDTLNDPAATSLITEATGRGEVTGDLLRNLRETAFLLRNDSLDRQLAVLGRRLGGAEVSQQALVEILTQQSELRKQKQQAID